MWKKEKRRKEKKLNYSIFVTNHDLFLKNVKGEFGNHTIIKGNAYIKLVRVLYVSFGYIIFETMLIIFIFFDNFI